MSQFSESYHFRGEDRQEVVKLLQESQLEGYILPDKQGWVTFVVKESNFEPLPAIIRNNRGVLLHYVYAEDHGWSLFLFQDEREVSRYICNWDDEIRIDNLGMDIQAFFNLGLIHESNFQAEWLQPQSFEELFDTEPCYKMAQALGIAYYDWISYHSVLHNANEFENLIHVTP
ncbi:hypothetical protein [Paenibacillus hexagrammi]|uniref:Uncharacterized protein n=1 Tax=Paenibacillus hexagrammi TaxID=2908839 RepID=A0ABY3SQA6_9BACL|nr:hypothetical protein [Paenibacillus sp. YPD9-1]UJF36032.1 hypothetical protein L0M14_13715 [Paenibacillus sp. YPD9-1]